MALLERVIDRRGSSISHTWFRLSWSIEAVLSRVARVVCVRGKSEDFARALYHVIFTYQVLENLPKLLAVLAGDPIIEAFEQKNR